MSIRFRIQVLILLLFVEKPIKRMPKKLVGKKKSLIEQQQTMTMNEDLDDDDFNAEGKEVSLLFLI